MDFTVIPVLTGTLATLEPLALEHAEELAEAVQDGQLHELWYARVPAPAKMREDIEGRLAQARCPPGRPVGDPAQQ